ncbi:MAG TPA: hypothetical protein GX497_07105 [Bacillus bacterium]|nr:hypothetical protein [Bacillus sp. (in: firmicutes)]
MDKSRKNIVLNEIKYWKEHRLLPEQYCDFLISLYTEGSEEEQRAFERKSRSYSYKKLLEQLFYTFILLQLVITLIVIYFTEISIHLQIGLFTIFVIISFSSFVYLFKKKHSFFHIALIIGILILFLASVHLVSVAFSARQIAIIITILLNCGIWAFIGFRLNLKYLIISGIAGAVLLLTYHFM